MDQVSYNSFLAWLPGFDNFASLGSIILGKLFNLSGFSRTVNAFKSNIYSVIWIPSKFQIEGNVVLFIILHKCGSRPETFGIYIWRLSFLCMEPQLLMKAPQKSLRKFSSQESAQLPSVPNFQAPKHNFRPTLDQR